MVIKATSENSLRAVLHRRKIGGSKPFSEKRHMRKDEFSELAPRKFSDIINLKVFSYVYMYML